MKSFIAALALTSLAEAASTRVCQQPELEQNFDVNRYLGLWYEARRDKECKFEGAVGTAKCNTAEYSMNDDGSIHVLNSEYEEDKGEWKNPPAVGKATVVDPSKNEGYLKVKFGLLIPSGDYKVVETDYDSYTVIYTCTGVSHIYNIEYVWILTRDANPSDETMQKAFDAVTNKIPGYDLSNLYSTESMLSSGDACPYDGRPIAAQADNDWVMQFLQ